MASILDGDIEEQKRHLVELPDDSSSPIPNASSQTSSIPDSSTPSVVADDQIIPLLPQPERPKINNIFSVSRPRRNPARAARVGETEISIVMQFVSWAWSGSRYSGLLSMALSSIIYCTMEVISDFFAAQAIPLFEVASLRCTVILILSVVWLRRSGQPIFGPTNARYLLILRAISGYISLMSFIYCIQLLPQSQAILLSFSTPIMASIAARFILQEKMRSAEIVGLASSFFGVLLIFQAMESSKEVPTQAGDESGTDIHGTHHIFAVSIGLVSSVAAGISYCFTRAGSKAADQPLLTVFAFSMLASPAAALCALVFQELVVPSFYTMFLMVVMGMLAFLAEITLARGLQLEKTSKVTNIQYVEVALSQLLGMCSSRVVPTLGSLVGCTLILISACSTAYLGPEKDDDE